MRFRIPLVASATLIVGFAVARATGVVWLGGIVLVLGGLPIREPIAHHGPFLMNTRQEILDAIDDFQSGRMGAVPRSG